jgi:hypothetical protein
MVITLLFIGKSLSLVLGWIGSFSYVLAYLLLSLNKLKSDQRLYHVLNIVGAVGLTVNAIFFQDYPNVIVNVFWGMIALMAILLIGRKKPG